MDAQDAAADALWDAANDHGAVIRVGLPRPVLREMQAIVDTCQWVCPHVESAGDLPAAVLPKLAVAGVGAISCLEPACIFELHDRSYQRQLRACVLCRHRLPSYDRVLFTDDAVNLSMAAPVCYSCAAPGGQLAEWAGLPGA